MRSNVLALKKISFDCLITKEYHMGNEILRWRISITSGWSHCSILYLYSWFDLAWRINNQSWTSI